MSPLGFSHLKSPFMKKQSRSDTSKRSPSLLRSMFVQRWPRETDEGRSQIVPVFRGTHRAW